MIALAQFLPLVAALIAPACEAAGHFHTPSRFLHHRTRHGRADDAVHWKHSPHLFHAAQSHATQGSGTVLFVGGLEATGHHLVSAVLEGVPGVYRFNEGELYGEDPLPNLWRVCRSGAQPPSTYLFETTRSEVLSTIASCLQYSESSNPLVLLNADRFMASYPDRFLSQASESWLGGLKQWWGSRDVHALRSPNATCLQQIFQGSSLDFKVLQLDRDLKTLIEHGQKYDGMNATKHAQVLAEQGQFLADQLESIPDYKRMCLHLEAADEQAGKLETFLDKPGVKNRLLESYSRERAAGHARLDGNPEWSMPEETLAMASRLGKLCSHSLSLMRDGAASRLRWK
mmetsp:Transcript_54208/g.129162  ORF Transcript_54208/g.129162 Transcript_54208/m.129162 type:complete len:343 (+) Transcript_54208:136-1164(+)